MKTNNTLDAKMTVDEALQYADDQTTGATLL